MNNSKFMKKSGIPLVAAGALIGIGIILSFYGNYIIFEDLAKTNGVVSSGNSLTLEVDLDNSKSKTGIFAVQIIDFKSQTVSAIIVDPLDNTIESKAINEESYEGVFDISISGAYKLIIENNGDELTVFGVIGPEPEEWKQSLAFVSLYILVIGLFGMALVAVLFAINRKRGSN